MKSYNEGFETEVVQKDWQTRITDGGKHFQSTLYADGYVRVYVNHGAKHPERYEVFHASELDTLINHLLDVQRIYNERIK